MTREQALDTLARLHAELVAGGADGLWECEDGTRIDAAGALAVIVDHDRLAGAVLGLDAPPGKPHPFEGVTLPVGCTQCFRAAATATNRRGEWACTCTPCGASWLALAGDERELDKRAAEVSR
jgi:hypothetical protein